MRPTPEIILAMRMRALEATEEIGCFSMALRETEGHLGEHQHDRAAMSFDDAQEFAANLEKIAGEIRKTAIHRAG